ncbi:hypothetical protein TNCV_3545141 [Trichonephila clavipes]|uniref:Uncharacterized protein n=1 Tax=Trichonephila clavipes TaxID=2585209 RepID=A0A8X6RGX4_TRICX|nr:hypothetical protein TNCV_3545141 [Trichonephila clavipes]
MLSDKCKWSWGHCLLFDLGRALTPRLAAIMIKESRHLIDNRRREESPGWRELEESAKERLDPRLEWKGRKDDERRWCWRIGVI